MIIERGDWALGETIPFFFPSYDSSGASVAATGLAVTDIEVYKLLDVTGERDTDASYSLLDTDGLALDGRLGINGFTIDTSDDSGTPNWSWEEHKDYLVVVDAVTIDSQTVRFVYTFSIGNRGHTLKCTLAGGGASSMTFPDQLGFPATTGAIRAYAVEVIAGEGAGYRGHIISYSSGRVAAVEPTGTSFDNTSVVKLWKQMPANDVTFPQVTVASIASAALDSIYNYVVEGSLTFVEVIRIKLAVLAGKSTGQSTTNPKFRNQADTKDRVDGTVDGNNNRTAVTVDGS